MQNPYTSARINRQRKLRSKWQLEAFVLKVKSYNPTLTVLKRTSDAVLDSFIEEDRLLEIKKFRLGESIRPLLWIRRRAKMAAS